MKWERHQQHSRTPIENALIACMRVEVPAHENDGSRRLMSYVRQCKRHGLNLKDTTAVVREMEGRVPPPKPWPDDKIQRCLAESHAEDGEAYTEDDWPRTNGHQASFQPRGLETIARASTPSLEPKREGELPWVEGSAVSLELADDISNDVAEVLFDCGDDLDGFEIGPGKITVIGAPPGTGKTALASQVMMNILAKQPGISILSANAEMDPKVLQRREISRLTGVSYQRLRFASYTPDDKRKVQEAQLKVHDAWKRVRFLKSPFRCHQINMAIEMIGEPGLLVVDYLQKFRDPSQSSQEGIEDVMNWLRHFAKAGWAVLALSSTSRQDGKGSKHDTSKLDMGSFRGSGEIEFQADSAYVMRKQSEEPAKGLSMNTESEIELACVKNRHGEPKSLNLIFSPAKMEFRAAELVNTCEGDFDQWNQGGF